MTQPLLRRPFAAITGLGVAVPPRVVDNAWFAERLDTSDEWIVERTGIRERRIADPSQTVADLSREASEHAMREAGITAADIDAIVLGPATPDRLLPSTACDLQVLLGAVNATAFDISAACPGFVYAMTVAEGLIASGQSRTALVIGAEKLSAITDMQDRGTAILFGDGAGAAIRKTCRRHPRHTISRPGLMSGGSMKTKAAVLRGVGQPFEIEELDLEDAGQQFEEAVGDIVVVRRGMVRRAKLYYLRNLTGKATRIKERKVRPGEGKAAKKA